jgi:hypothetical protein
MKRTSMVMAVIAVASLLLAMTGCDMQIRDKCDSSDRGVVSESDGTFSLSTSTFSSYTTTTDSESCIDVQAAGNGCSGKAGQIGLANVTWDNPLYGKNVSAVTIKFDVYSNPSGTYSGVLGFYDKTYGGFLWFTNTQFFLNTTANNASSPAVFAYKDTQSLGLSGSKWESIALVITSSKYTVYKDGTEVLSGTSLQTSSSSTTDVSKMITFLENNADVIAVGTGVDFWDNSGYTGSYIKNIEIYQKALTSSELGATYSYQTISVDDNGYYNFDIPSAKSAIIDGKAGLDVYDVQSATTQDTEPTISWKNPLYGKTLSAGATIICDFYNTSGTGAGALWTFHNGGEWSMMGLLDDGEMHSNYGGNWVDWSASGASTGSWHRAVYVVGSDGSASYYVDGTAVTVTYDSHGSGTINAFTGTQYVGVGVGLTATWCAAGSVSSGSYIKNFKVAPTALSAAQVSALGSAE